MTRVLDEIVEEALRELSDEQDQARLWRSSGGTEVSSAKSGGVVYDGGCRVILVVHSRR